MVFISGHQSWFLSPCSPTFQFLSLFFSLLKAIIQYSIFLTWKREIYSLLFGASLFSYHYSLFSNHYKNRPLFFYPLFISRSHFRVGSHVVFFFGITARMFDYTVLIFWSNVSRFLYHFSSIPRKLYNIFQPTFFPIKCYQDILFMILTFRTNSVRKKIIFVRTVYFFNLRLDLRH